MSLLTEKLDLFREQAAAITQTINAIARLIDVETAEGSHGKRIATIQRTICEHFDLPLEAMSSRIRTNRYAHPRQIALFLSRELTKHSNEQIGHAFRPDMDHGTVTHACNTVQSRYDTEKTYRATVDTLRARCIERIEVATMPLFDFVNSKSATAPTSPARL
jgi:chromosomal replication initiation ATPase DnaA